MTPPVRQNTAKSIYYFNGAATSQSRKESSCNLEIPYKGMLQWGLSACTAEKLAAASSAHSASLAAPGSPPCSRGINQLRTFCRGEDVLSMLYSIVRNIDRLKKLK